MKVKDAGQAGLLRLVARSAGLSFGDHLYLAVAQHLKVRVLTVDRAWLLVAQALGLEVCRIR